MILFALKLEIDSKIVCLFPEYVTLIVNVEIKHFSSFRGLRQLRSELATLNKECEKNEGNIQNFLSSFLPEYRECTKPKFDKNNNNNDTFDGRKSSITETPKDVETKSQHFQNQIKLSTGKNADKSRSEESSTESVEVSDAVGERLPVPTVTYDWSGSPGHGSSARMPSYLPKSGFSLYFF